MLPLPSYAKLCQAMPSLLKTDFLFLKAKSAEKIQIHNIKNGFYNFNNPNNSNNPCEPFGISEQLTAREANTISWEKVGEQLGESWGAVGRKLGNRICGHLGQLVYMHVKILKPEVKRPDV